MTDPIPSPRSPQPGPLTPEEEALLRDGLADPSQVPSCARGIAALDILPRVLATLDAERDQWDGLSARAIEAEHALATIRPAVDEFVAAQDANTGDAGADSKRIWNAQTTLRAARLTPIPSPDTDLRAAVASFFDGRRRRAPAAEMLRLTAVMADALNGSSSESTETPCVGCGEPTTSRMDDGRPKHVGCPDEAPEFRGAAFMVMSNAARHDYSCAWGRPGVLDAERFPCTCGLADDIAALRSESTETLDAAPERPTLDVERFVRLATAVMQLRDFLALHRTATGRSDVNIRKVLRLLDDALSDQPAARLTDSREQTAAPGGQDES